MHVLVLLLALFSWSLTHGSDQLDFKQWSSVHLPYATQDELDAIYPTWKKNAELVSAHNQQNSQFTTTLNKFAHLTSHQVPKIPPRFLNPESKAYFHNRLPENTPPPESFDWRDHNVITPVHDQGTLSCSDPLVLSDAVSSLHAFVSKDLVQFSYEQLLDCCWHCNCSGLVNISYHCITKLNLCSAAQYPSQPASQCKCLHESECDFHIAGAWIIPPGGEVGLVTAVLISPIMATIDASLPSFQLYKSGIYSSKMCSSTHVDHTVFLVGYGENEQGKYWICKNSWGVDWGMDGYFLLARNQDNMCGIAAQASYLYV